MGIAEFALEKKLTYPDFRQVFYSVEVVVTQGSLISPILFVHCYYDLIEFTSVCINPFSNSSFYPT